MGRVALIERDAVTVDLDANAAIAPLKPGDGMVFDAADWRSPEEREEGGRVYHVRLLGNKQARLNFANNAHQLCAHAGRAIGSGDQTTRRWTKPRGRLLRPNRRCTSSLSMWP